LLLLLWLMVFAGYLEDIIILSDLHLMPIRDANDVLLTKNRYMLNNQLLKKG